MRRYVLAVVAAFVALTLAACGAGTTPTNDGATATTQDATTQQSSGTGQDTGKVAEASSESQNISDMMNQTLMEYYQANGTILANPEDEADEESDEATLSTDADANVPDDVERSIVGTDDRIAPSDSYKYPLSTIALIQVHFPCKHGNAAATGFMVRPTILLTSAYALYCEECQARATNAVYYFGCQPDGNYRYKYDGMVTVAFGTKHPSQNGGWNYAIVRFDERVGDETGYFGVGIASDDQFEGKEFVSAGYREGQLAYDVDKTYVRDNGTVWLYTDTAPTYNGGPIFSGDKAVGIIAGTTPGGERNVGCRITREIVNKIREVEASTTSKQTPTSVTQQQAPLVVKPSETGPRGFILPYSATHEYTRNELSGLTVFELYLARNEIPARHGYIFEGEDLQAYFNSKTWYRGTLKKDEFRAIEGILNTTEETNVDTILAMEREQNSPYAP